MSWQLGILAGVSVVVLAGFVSYERSHPDSRLIAIVAALTALAVAGRLVLTPIPNLVATTDVAVISGYALGAVPGFAVGALAAPISNMWLGQGPWTVWEMAGWGLAGLIGAGLARFAGRRVGRLGLASACALTGLLYGALLDLSVMVSYGGEQSLDRYLALSARSIPFNFVHAAGNFAIALAAGPALVRMIARYRERSTFRWHPAGALPFVVLVSVLAGALPHAGRAEAAAGAGAASSWLRHAQGPDGGYAAGPSLPSSTTMTGWSMLGLEAAGINPGDVAGGGTSAVAYLRAHAGGIRSTGDLERSILALAGAGVNPRSFAGRDLVGELAEKRDGDGSFDSQVNLTAFGIMALKASGSGAAVASKRWLLHAQLDDGGWSYRPGAPAGDADSTGAALQGLAASGVGGRPLQRGAGFLVRSQRTDGGWPLAGGPTNSQSTAWALQGLIAAARNPAAIRSGGRSGLDYLRARQAADGHYRYSKASDQTPVWVTAQALLASRRKTFPLAAVPRTPKHATGAKGGESTSWSTSSGVGGGSGRRSRGGGPARGNVLGRDSRGRNPQRGHGAAPAAHGARGLGDSHPAGGAAGPRLDRAAATRPLEGPAPDRASRPGVVVGGVALLLAIGGALWWRRDRVR